MKHYKLKKRDILISFGIINVILLIALLLMVVFKHEKISILGIICLFAFFNFIIIITLILYCKYQTKIMNSKKLLLKERKEYKEDIKMSSQAFVYDKDNKCIKRITCIYLDKFLNFSAVYLLVGCLLLTIYVYIIISYVFLLNDIVANAIVKTNNNIILIKAKSKSFKNIRFDYLIMSDLTSGLLKNIFEIMYIINIYKNITMKNEYEESLLNDLMNEEKILKIIEYNNSNYYITVYDSPILLKNKKYYYLFSTSELMNDGKVKKEKVKIYKVYKNIEKLI